MKRKPDFFLEQRKKTQRKDEFYGYKMDFMEELTWDLCTVKTFEGFCLRYNKTNYLMDSELKLHPGRLRNAWFKNAFYTTVSSRTFKSRISDIFANLGLTIHTKYDP